jgi:diguanylate cyclase (GGDEF)-like protein
MPSAITVILLLGAIVLACGSVGLFIVRWNNRLLRGLGWLGGSFACGGACAIVLMMDHIPDMAGAVIADALVMLSFVLLHVAILELVESDSLFPAFGVIILVVQIALDLYLFSGHYVHGVRVPVLSVLIAAQAGQTAIILFRKTKDAVRAPAWFSGTILLGFMLLNVARGIALLTGFLKDSRLFYEVEALTYGVYIAIALGIAFGFFWMTTTMLSVSLERMASTDPLTRLYNRRVFLLWCDKELLRSKRTGDPFSILMIDLDHFKKINDEFGHPAGDMALCSAVEKMQSSIRGIDVLGRWGGEEFVALLPSADPDAALAVAERVRANIEKILLPARSLNAAKRTPGIRMTVSVGVTTYTGSEDNLQDMLQRADESLYRAKALGRNRVLAAPELSLISA